jgi:RNA polymerase sigma factor (sigma-70 family)
MFDDKYTYINDLVSKYQNNKDKESLFLLYDFYKPLFLSSIKRCINKDSRLSVHREDLLSECIFVLEKLINQYDPDLTYFSYFLSTRIDINLLRHITSKFIKEHEESSESIHIEASYDPFNTIDTVLSLESAIKQLPQEQVVAIQMYFFQQLDQKEASLMLGITQGAFSKRLSKALQQLKTILGDDFLFD